MMIIFLLIYLIIVLYGFKINPYTNNYEYISIDNTNSIKGIFILIVFFSHYNSYIDFTSKIDIIYLHIISKIGQSMVAMFLFYSGYGIMESIKKKNIQYIHNIPKKRILNTFLRFDLAVIIFGIVSLILGREITIKKIILAVIGWDSLGNSNWYIFSIIVLYLFTWISFNLIYEFFKTIKYDISIILLTVITILYMIFILNFKQTWWADTLLCYILGMFYSMINKKIYETINKYKTLYFTILSMCIIITMTFKFIPYNFIISCIVNIIFCLTVIIITMKFQFKNQILSWCGNNLFELYILQRLPMIILKDLRIMDNYPYLSFVLSVIFTIIIIPPFKYIEEKITKYINFNNI